MKILEILQSDAMAFLIRQTLIYAVPLMIVALAGVFSERSGVINLALEGIMIFGAFAGVMIVRFLQSTGWFQEAYELLNKVPDMKAEMDFSKFWQIQGFGLMCMAITAIISAMFSMLLAFAAIHLRADQTISGTALNLLAPALVLFLVRIIIGGERIGMLDKYNGVAINDPSIWFGLKESYFGYGLKITRTQRTPGMPFFGQAFVNQAFPMTYICILLFIVLAILLYKTRFGLRLRACGENPQAADSLGINVYKMRYSGVAISGALAGIGGFLYATTVAGCMVDGSVAGFGFLALAVMIFGNWKPLNIALSSLLFGFLKCISASYNSLDFLNKDGVYELAQLGISSHVYNLLPYVITLLVLALTSKSSRAPKAEGIPYDKGKR